MMVVGLEEEAASDWMETVEVVVGGWVESVLRLALSQTLLLLLT